MPRYTEDEEPDDDDSADGGPIPFWMFVLLEAGLAPIAVALGWGLKLSPLADFSWDREAALWGLAAAVPMIALMALAMRWPIGPLGRIKAFLERNLLPALEGCEWPDLALVSVAAGFGEEMLFRGVIQGALSRAFGPGVGIAAASLLFGILHPVSASYVIMAGLLGAYLGVVWLLTGNLLTVIVAHSVYDFVALLVLVSGQRKAAESDREAR